MKKLIAALCCSVLSCSALAAGSVSAGKALAEKYNCFTCHGKDYNTPLDPSYPKLAGQHKDYLQHALTAYKRGDAANGRAGGAAGTGVRHGRARRLAVRGAARRRQPVFRHRNRPDQNAPGAGADA